MFFLVVFLMLLSSTCCLRGQQGVLTPRQVIITDHANTIDGQMLLLRNASGDDRIQTGVDASDRGEVRLLSPRSVSENWLGKARASRPARSTSR